MQRRSTRSLRPTPTLLVLAAATTVASAPAQQFATLSKRLLPTDLSASDTAAAAADIDGDGDLDLVVATDGSTPHTLYINRQGRFLEPDTTGRLPAGAGIVALAVAFDDVDADGDPDLVLGSTDRDRLYINSGGFFVDVTTARMPNIAEVTTAVEFADLDGDGDPDLAVATRGLPSSRNRIYLNTGGGFFVDGTGQLPNLLTRSRSVSTGDVDADGDIDIVFVLEAAVGPPLQLLLNDGTGTFTLSTGNLPPRSPAPGNTFLRDIDGDGDLDLIEGNRVLTNDGNGTFAERPAQWPAGAHEAARLAADLDRDGDIDVLARVLGLGYDEYDILLNDGAGTFTRPPADRVPDLRPVGDIGPAFDFDGDGAPEVFVSRTTQRTLLLNDGTGTFADPSTLDDRLVYDRLSVAQVALLDDVDGDTAPDVFVGTTPGMFGGRNRLYVNDDRGEMSDATAMLPVLSDEVDAAALVDLDGDGDRDLLLGGGPGGPAAARVQLNDGAGNFSLLPGAVPSLVLSVSSLAVGDVDGDSDEDSIVADLGAIRLLLNDGTATFTQAPAGSLPSTAVGTRDMALVDVDGDLDRDLVVVTTNGNQNRIYVNDGLGTFTDETATRLPALADNAAAVAVADVDGDGDADLVVGGFSEPRRLFRNIGAGVFALSSGLPATVETTLDVELVDLDGDGDPDLIATGPTGASTLVNDGTGVFSPAEQITTGGETTVATRDIDFDGDADLLLTVTGLPGGNTDVALLVNLRRHIHTPLLPAPGQPWQVDVYVRGVPASTIAAAALFVSFADASIPVQGLGVFGLDPAATLAGPVFAIPQPDGVGSTVLPIPPILGLVGQTLFVQALVGEIRAGVGSFHLTNTQADVVF